MTPLVRRLPAVLLAAAVLASAAAMAPGDAGAASAAAPAAPSGFRGDGTGLYPKADPPTTWDAEDGAHVLWEAQVGKGQSSPLALGGRVFVTAEPDLLVCVDRASGKVLWKKANPPSVPLTDAIEKRKLRTSTGCGYAAPSPVTDGERVYASYATGVVVCYDPAGNCQWLRDIDRPQVLQYGRSASPVLADGKLLVSLSGLIALDPKTGKDVWVTTEAKPAYGTPAVTRIGDVVVVITPEGDCVRARDGRILASTLGCTKYTSPLVDAGVVYFVDQPTAALRLPAQAGDAIKAEKVWENDDVEGEFFASPVCHGGLLYAASNERVLYALDAATGKIVFRKELEMASAGSDPANVYPSLTLAGRRLILATDAGTALVLEPGREFKPVATNYLDKGSGASPVPDGRLLFLRGGTRLYGIGTK